MTDTDHTHKQATLPASFFAGIYAGPSNLYKHSFFLKEGVTQVACNFVGWPQALLLTVLYNC